MDKPVFCRIKCHLIGFNPQIILLAKLWQEMQGVNRRRYSCGVDFPVKWKPNAVGNLQKG